MYEVRMQMKLYLIIIFVLVFLYIVFDVRQKSTTYLLIVGPHVDETLNPNKYEEDK
jgi:hypothetical protein